MPYFDTPRILDGEILSSLLDELAGKLDEDDFYRLVGLGSGTLMLLGMDGCYTNDLDAFSDGGLELDGHFRDAVLAVAQEHREDLHLANDWVNDDVLRVTVHLDTLTYRDYLPMVDDGSAMFFDGGDDGGAIEVKPLFLEGILLCKLVAGREKDVEHIEHILDKLEIKSLVDLVDGITRVIPSAPRQWYWDQAMEFAGSRLKLS